jgi:hypothetical protein
MNPKFLLTPRLKKACAIAEGYIHRRGVKVLGTPELLLGIVRSEGPALAILSQVSGRSESEVALLIIAEVDKLHPAEPRVSKSAQEAVAGP